MSDPPRKRRDWGRRAFSPARKRAIASLVEAMFSDENEDGIVPAPATLVDRVVDDFDLLVGAGSTDLRRGFTVLAFLVEWLPILILGELGRASRLPLARRLAYLRGLEHAKMALLATLFVAFKLPLTMIAYEMSPELGLTGFDRPTISTARKVRKLELIETPAADGETQATSSRAEAVPKQGHA